MFFLPRICEHCLNPSCVASCPSGAMYKREEDGIVLVDQNRCRGWRYCVSGCPYKKVYFNHRTGKAEKCTLCYPRIEIGQPTICSETCVGRIRYLGLVLYDADRVEEAASVPTRTTCSPRSATSSWTPRTRRCAPPLGATASRGLDRARPPLAGLRPGYPLGRRAAAASRVPHAADGLVRPAAVAGRLDAGGRRLRGRPDDVFGAIDNLRIPLEYLANLLTAGDTDVVSSRAAPPRGDALVHAQARGARRDRRAARRRASG